MLATSRSQQWLHIVIIFFLPELCGWGGTREKETELTRKAMRKGPTFPTGRCASEGDLCAGQGTTQLDWVETRWGKHGEVWTTEKARNLVTSLNYGESNK